MKKILVLIPAFMFLFLGCPNQDSTPQPPRPTPIPTGTEFCDDAEKHLSEMCQSDSNKNQYCCAVVAPTKKRKTYTQFCTEKQTQGIWLNPQCLSTVTSCDQIDACTYSN